MSESYRYTDPEQSAIYADFGDGRTATVPKGTVLFDLLVRGRPAVEDQSPIPAKAIEPYRSDPVDLLLYARAARWAKEVGGLSWKGQKIPTDDRAKLLIGRAAGILLPNERAAFIVAGVNYGSLTGLQFKDIDTAIGKHLQATFKVMEQLLPQITAKTITTAQIDAAFAAISTTY